MEKWLDWLYSNFRFGQEVCLTSNKLLSLDNGSTNFKWQRAQIWALEKWFGVVIEAEFCIWTKVAQNLFFIQVCDHFVQSFVVIQLQFFEFVDRLSPSLSSSLFVLKGANEISSLCLLSLRNSRERGLHSAPKSRTCRHRKYFHKLDKKIPLDNFS